MLLVPALGSASRAPTLIRLHADDADLAARARSAVLGLYSLDVRLTAARRRLVTVEVAARRLRRERASIDLQLREARLDSRISLQRLAARVRFVYEHGTPSALELVLGAKSLDEAMTQLDDYNRVADADHDVLVQVQSARTHLVRLSQALVVQTKSIAATTRVLEQTVAELGQAEAARSGYVTQLQHQRALNAIQIAQLSARAQAADALTLQLTQSRAPAATIAPAAIAPTPAVASGSRTLTVTATGYDLSGTTATGLPVGWGVAAVDPSVIPLGTHLIVPGYGEAIAADTGSAVHGDTIDLWFPSQAQAEAWGRRTVSIAFHG